MANVAQEVIKPTQAGIFRSVYLYTGQGETTLLVIPTGPNVEDYQYVLVDCDQDKESDEIELISLFKDLFTDGQKIDVYINTHPHADHTAGIKDLYDEIGITEVWHSNHKASGKDEGAYKELKYVLDKVGKSNEYHLKGTNDVNKLRKSDKAETEVVKKIGNVDYIVLSPAEYVCDDIDGEDEKARYRRIHEQCGVIRFGYGSDPKHIMMTGDSDKKAWKEHITDYHKDHLTAIVLSASHHGSRTFFKENEDDEDVYEEHIKFIEPTYLIISAPKQADSPHDHPHDDAMELYKKYVDPDNILHLGENLESVIIDIDSSGQMDVRLDKRLVETYGRKKSDSDQKRDTSDSKKAIGFGVHVGSSGTKIDNKPMG
ncbi:ComEC/Rec2 family competence protein [Siphonobacter curvatus]|uniref:Metallo-beta-lactamase domain-containing protein n=1 Tax=Siphonobacter curvatus TaxID=2094562 RepID=A0A2S7II43_9BACT|nr:MBL fold metallo-hydrolase [Siphonobacter curvatus]PQA55659.1 hypothetical protein C5O19_19810 [Siphonobacter curvatus]